MVWPALGSRTAKEWNRQVARDSLHWMKERKGACLAA